MTDSWLMLIDVCETVEKVYGKYDNFKTFLIRKHRFVILGYVSKFYLT